MSHNPSTQATAAAGSHGSGPSAVQAVIPSTLSPTTAHTSYGATSVEAYGFVGWVTSAVAFGEPSRAARVSNARAADKSSDAPVVEQLRFMNVPGHDTACALEKPE
jgi:hypothetical protein